MEGLSTSHIRINKFKGLHLRRITQTPSHLAREEHNRKVQKASM